MKLVVLYILAMPFAVLPFAAASRAARQRARRLQPGAHGLSEVLYNFASTANNNGSAFAYQTTGTQWYTTTQGISMLMGRFFTHHPGAGHRRFVGRQTQGARRRPARCPPHTPLFGVLVVGVVAHRRRTHLLPGPVAGPHPRTPLTVRMTRDRTTITPRHPTRSKVRTKQRHVDLRSGDHRVPLRSMLPQAQPAHACTAIRSCSSSRSDRC